MLQKMKRGRYDKYSELPFPENYISERLGSIWIILRPCSSCPILTNQSNYSQVKESYGIKLEKNKKKLKVRFRSFQGSF